MVRFGGGIDISFLTIVMLFFLKKIKGNRLRADCLMALKQAEPRTLLWGVFLLKPDDGCGIIWAGQYYGPATPRLMPA